MLKTSTSVLISLQLLFFWQICIKTLTRCYFDVEWWGNKNIYHFRCPLHYIFIKNSRINLGGQVSVLLHFMFYACIESLTRSKKQRNFPGSSILVVDCSKYTHDLFDIDTHTIIRMAVNGQLLYPISLECLFNYFKGHSRLNDNAFTIQWIRKTNKSFIHLVA